MHTGNREPIRTNSVFADFPFGQYDIGNSVVLYVLSTGCQWRAIPKDLPPRSTVCGYSDLWSWDGTLDRMHHELYVKCREAVAREASPTACIIDSQSVKSAEKGGPQLILRATRPSHS